MQALRLIFLGPPGTGKGTQASRLSRRFGLTALSSGDTLRNEIRQQSEVGLSAKAYMDAGKLVPDEVITGVMLLAIARLPAGSGYILDGFPRTVPQAEALELGLEARGAPIHRVVDFVVADQVIVERIASRRVCSNCFATYNTRFFPPAVAGVCDKCGGEVVQRADDREDVIVTRLATYRAQTAPLVEFYERRGLLSTVDAAQDADAVEQELLRVVSALGAKA